MVASFNEVRSQKFLNEVPALSHRSQKFHSEVPAKREQKLFLRQRFMLCLKNYSPEFDFDIKFYFFLALANLRLKPAPKATAVPAPRMVRGSGTGVFSSFTLSRINPPTSPPA